MKLSYAQFDITISFDFFFKINGQSDKNQFVIEEIKNDFLKFYIKFKMATISSFWKSYQNYDYTIKAESHKEYEYICFIVELSQDRSK